MAASTASRPPTSTNSSLRPSPSPNLSAYSLHSSDDEGHSSFPSANGSIKDAGSLAPTNGNENRRSSLTVPGTTPLSPPVPEQSTITAPPLKKPGFGTRLSRMFSHRGDSPSAAPPSDGNRPRAPSSSNKPSSFETSTLSRPSLPTRDSSARPTTRATQIDGNERTASVSRERVTSETPAPKKDVTPAVHDAHGQPSRRFVLLEDGTHEHNLKPERRQEKLSDLFGKMMGKKKEGQVEDHQLSLMSGWVDQLRNEKVANDVKGGPNATVSLTEKYGKCQEVVGRGAFGIVRISHKVDETDPKKERLYAVKEFRRRPSENLKKYNKRLTSEFCISSALRHPNVIHTLDLMKDAKGDFCEVMEFCAGGDLYTLVLAAGKLEVLEADCYFKQLMRGVEYIHEMGVAHRDLKPENLLLTHHGALKITDFGNGECFRMAWEKEPHMVAGLCGSAPYIAPEEYVDEEFDPRAVDVWACGVIYMAMRTGRHLWRLARKDEDEFYERYLEGRRDEDGYGPIETLHRARCRNVIYSILDPNPSRRISASQVLKSEWGREINICKAGEEGF